MSEASRAGELDADAARSMPLHAEEATVSRRVRRTLVRAVRTTASREQVVEAELDRVDVVIERVAIGRVVDQAPPVRIEGDVTIVPVVEEELVLVRRLILKEEVRLRTVRSVRRHVETVVVREQVVSVTRTPLED